jgi:mannose-1-phosphate guanylyltransferase/mannose-6-phosphate isomerase
MSEVVPVVLSGGAGSRLWPLSRESSPKQLLPMLGASTMLQETVHRAAAVAPSQPPLVVCNVEHRFAVAAQARAAGQALGPIVLEPMGRNTAPAIAIAALLLNDGADGAPSIMLVMPADHVIQDVDAFAHAVQQGAELARAGRLVTFGIVPTRAETGYGYIRGGAPVDGSAGRDVDAFVEKPDARTAADYVASGNYYWNSGMFLMRTDIVLEELRAFEPGIVLACEAALADARREGAFVHLDSARFAEATSKSIDYAVMERTRRAAVVPLDAGWSDVGAWDAVWAESSPDAAGNVTQGDVIIEGAQGCYVRAEDRLVAVVGVDDLVVVDTKDALLVVPRARAQDVKNVVTRLQSQARSEAKLPHVVPRPWGTYQSLDNGASHQVKRIVVHPGQKLSLQKHHKRAEHWIVVAGTAMVTIDDRRFPLRANESCYIQLGSVHRLENEGDVDLVLIEVQTGTYLGEDDIVRLEDVYGRTPA